MGFEKCSVQQLRDMLVENNLKTEEEAGAIKGKANLVYELIQAGIAPPEETEVIEQYIQHVDKDENIVEELVQTLTEESDDRQIMPTDPEWKEYVLSHFNDSEVFEVNKQRYPSLAGLRRVTELLVGDIVFSGPVDHRTTHPTPELPLGACTVVYEIQLLWKLGMPEYLTDALPQKTFRGMAGAHQNNVDDDFALYPEAIAETRAEARALRKALSLSVVSYDEITTKKVADIVVKQEVKNPDWNPEDMINDTQKTAIMMKCEQGNIDVTKFINSGAKQYESIDQITKGTAAAMIKTLSAYLQDGETSKSIPAAILKN